MFAKIPWSIIDIDSAEKKKNLVGHITSELWFTMDTPYQEQSIRVIAFDLQFTFVFAQIPNVPEDNWVWSSQDAINMHLPERLVHSYLKKESVIKR